MAYPAPTKGRSKLSPNAAMLFAPFGCTHPPPPAPPFLLAQSLSLKDIAGCDIMKLKVSRCRYATLGLKGLSAGIVSVFASHPPRLAPGMSSSRSTRPRSRYSWLLCLLYLDLISAMNTLINALPSRPYILIIRF